jgi:mannose-6-phosphate isomerase-like protein (cupin superfamily)
VADDEKAMLIVPLQSRDLFTAGDRTHLREIIDPRLVPGLRYSIAHASLDPGQASQLHLLLSSEVYHIVSGEGVMHIAGEEAEVAAGDTIYVPPGAQQFIRNTGDGQLVFLCIVDPAWRAEDEQVI